MAEGTLLLNITTEESYVDQYLQDNYDVKISYVIMLVMTILVILFIIPILISFRQVRLSLIKGSIAYFFLFPTYVNIFNIYAVINLHQVGYDKNKPLKQTSYEHYRAWYLFFWVMANSLIGFVIGIAFRSEYS